MQANGRVLLVLAVAALAGCNAGQISPVQTQPGSQQSASSSEHLPAAGGGFDFYLLNLSWSPEFCATHGDAAECAEHDGFVLHGLWPQNYDGSYPQHCASTAGPTDASRYRDIFPDQHLLLHEWQTHGTCSGLSARDYFATARAAKKKVVVPKELVAPTSELQLSPSAILGDFAAANPSIPRESFALSCGNNRLTAIEVCLGKDLNAVSCKGIRSCRANVVKVTPPGGE
jgi:ribonuclease T2